jgi:calcineurin-like phosphoesterase family protein
MNSQDTQHELSDTTASVPEGVRVYAIGDIHGRADLLERQHALIEADFTANGAPVVHLVYLGDYIDRGPDSFGVVERLAEGPSSFVNVTLLRGNHEAMLLRFLEDPAVGPGWRQLGGLTTILSYGVDVEGALKEGGYPGLAEQFKAKLPARHRTLFAELKPSTTIGDYFFCHAGVRPGIPLEEQKQQDLLWIRDQFLDATEDFGKVIVHGHSPVEQPAFHKTRINIDTGAYATGRLTCLVLEGRSRRILST